MRATLLVVSLVLVMVIACGRGQSDTGRSDDRLQDRHQEEVGHHMAVHATLAAHFIAAATRADMTDDEVNAVLAQVVGSTIIDEFRISDSEGVVQYSNLTDPGFVFPTSETNSTPQSVFADLLTGERKVVMLYPRNTDPTEPNILYVGVSGVDSPRIVQVGKVLR